MCRYMHWSYADLMDAPVEAYNVIVEMIMERAPQTTTSSDGAYEIELDT